MSIKLFLEDNLSKSSLETLEECINILKNKDNILICGHANPDGDALGSMAAMGYICKHLGKNYLLYNESELPDYLSFLPFPKKIEHDIDNLSFKPDLLIILDCGERNRIGEKADKVLRLAPSINIDHHSSNPNFASLLNWVDTSMAATANAIACLALFLNIPLTNELAFCLYTSIITDTGSFSHGNTNARALLTAGHMVNLGLDASIISSNLNNQWTENKTKLWGYLLSNYSINSELSIVYVLVSNEILSKFQCTKEDLEGFVEQLRRIKNIRIAALLREGKTNEVKVSFRSQHNDDVSLLASFFGGGGHKNAAGATLKTNLDNAKDMIIETIKTNKKKILI